MGALGLFWAVRHTFLRFLFERPQRFWIAPKIAPKAAPEPVLALQPAE
jgi:hypothetical protein